MYLDWQGNWKREKTYWVSYISAEDILLRDARNDPSSLEKIATNGMVKSENTLVHMQWQRIQSAMYNTRNYLCTLLYISCKAYGPFFVPLFFLAHLLVILGLGLLMYICFHAPLCTHTTIIIIIQFFILSLCSASFMVSTSHNGSLRN
jgi:hypothetical protein